ncbi:MAG: hypothetical protein U0521_15895 [Anaerolineae bacterium]
MKHRLEIVPVRVDQRAALPNSALAASTSSRPKRATVCSTAVRMASASVTSAGMVRRVAMQRGQRGDLVLQRRQTFAAEAGSDGDVRAVFPRA